MSDPAAGRAAPSLPTTFRPLWARRVIYPVAAVLVAGLAALAFALPGWSSADRGALIGFGLVLAAGLTRLAAVRVEADRAGITVVNIVTRRRLEWPEVIDLRLGQGDPWLVLDLSDGSSLPAMGVQGSDGEYARQQARRLGRLVAAGTRVPPDAG